MKFSSNFDDALEKNVAGICTITSDYVDAAASEAEESICGDPTSVSCSHHPVAISGASLSVASDSDVACAAALLAKLTKNVSVSA